MMNGETGEMMQAQIFMCPIFYQRLKHMVDYKKHARGRGRRNALTKQPNEGRRNKGGLRFGEMEKDTTGTSQTEVSSPEPLAITGLERAKRAVGLALDSYAIN